MRVCWNRQTGTFEGRVSYGVWVQVPSLAPRRRGLCIVRDDFSFEKSSAHSRRCSSFPQKSHACYGCSLVNALTTARCRYQLFASRINHFCPLAVRCRTHSFFGSALFFIFTAKPDFSLSFLLRRYTRLVFLFYYCIREVSLVFNNRKNLHRFTSIH